MTDDIEKKIIKTQIEGLNNIKLQLIKKKNAIELAEVNLSDPNQLHQSNISLTDINEKIDSINNQISNIKSSQNDEISDISITDENENLRQALEVFNQEATNLNFNSTKEDIAKIISLKSKLFENIFKDIDEKIEFIVSKRELLHSSAIFDEIYGNEILSTTTISEILKIRQNHENYKWYDRSIIVSALSLSLINFKFDSKKANILLDFVTDFENPVWQRALTGLVISIAYQKNRAWQRDNNLITRLKTLQNNENIQDGVKTIDFILKNELYKASLYNPDIFSADLFKSPINIFIPFYENNEVLKNAIDNANNDFDIDFFQSYINSMPLLDSHKYYLCIILSNNNLKKKEVGRKRSQEIKESIIYSTAFSPYQNLISDYYFFFNHFPQKLKDDVFNNQLIITNTDLKKIVLNKITQLLLEANSLFDELKFTLAIAKYEELLKINKYHNEARLQLANCYVNINKFDKAIKVYEELEKEIPSKDLSYKKARCYYYLEKYKISIEICNQIEQTNEYIPFRINMLQAENYIEIEDLITATSYCDKAQKSASEETELYSLSQGYFFARNFESALKVILEILEISPKSPKYWTELGIIYCELFKWELSLDAFKKAKEFSTKKDSFREMNEGRALLFSKLDYEKANSKFENILKTNKKYSDLTHGNLGHLYFIKNDKIKSREHYIKCLELLKDEKEFKRRMSADLKFFKNFNISEKEYNSITEDIINQCKQDKIISQ